MKQVAHIINESNPKFKVSINGMTQALAIEALIAAGCELGRTSMQTVIGGKKTIKGYKLHIEYEKPETEQPKPVEVKPEVKAEEPAPVRRKRGAIAPLKTAETKPEPKKEEPKKPDTKAPTAPVQAKEQPTPTPKVEPEVSKVEMLTIEGEQYPKDMVMAALTKIKNKLSRVLVPGKRGGATSVSPLEILDLEKARKTSKDVRAFLEFVIAGADDTEKVTAKMVELKASMGEEWSKTRSLHYCGYLERRGILRRTQKRVYAPRKAA